MAKITRKGKESAQRQLKAKVKAFALPKAQTLVPVVDGTLKDSLKVVDGEGYNVILGSDLDYAEYVEQGTAGQEPQPYLRPAMRRMK